MTKMTDSQFDAYKNDRYRKFLDFCDNRAIKNQRGYRICSILVLVVAVVISPLISFDDQLCGWGIILTKLLSPAAAIAVGISAHYQFHENWLRYRSTWDALNHELAYHDAGILDYTENEKGHELFVERVEALITDEGASWRRTVARKETSARSA